MTTRYKLYAHALNADDPEPVIVDDLTHSFPRFNAETDADAIAHAASLVGCHPDRQAIGDWELTELDAQDMNIRDVHTQTLYHGECGNCNEQEATRFCDGCDFNVCEECYILHNNDLDGQEPQGFVVVNVSNTYLIARDNDPDGPVVFDNIQDARECAAEARALDGAVDIYVYRVGPVVDTREPKGE